MASYKLFPIPLQGQGTADVESLPSYLFRSAYIHGVSVGVFLKVIHELWPSARRSYTTSMSGKNGVETLARVNRYTRTLRSTLTVLTGQDLSCEPLRFLDSQVYCISSEIGGFRWCPECLAEMERVEAPVYMKQLWHMTAIIHCPIHRAPLVKQCEFCGCKQTSFKVGKPFDYCIGCDMPLSRRKKKLTIKQIQPSWECLSHDIVEIFERASRPDAARTEGRSARYFLDSIYRSSLIQSNPNNHISSELRYFLKEYFRNWKGSCRLISLRRLAYLMNISLYDLLSANEQALQLPLMPLGAFKVPEHLKQRKKLARNHKCEYEKIIAIIENQKTPPSLKQLARLGNISVGYLAYRFPCLVRQVVENYQKHLTKQALMKRYQAQAAALKFFTNERYAPHTQSRKEAYRVLSEETGLPKWVLKDAIQVAYSILHTEG